MLRRVGSPLSSGIVIGRSLSISIDYGSTTLLCWVWLNSSSMQVIMVMVYVLGANREIFSPIRSTSILINLPLWVFWSLSKYRLAPFMVRIYPINSMIRVKVKPSLPPCLTPNANSVKLFCKSSNFGWISYCISLSEEIFKSIKVSSKSQVSWLNLGQLDLSRLSLSYLSV